MNTINLTPEQEEGAERAERAEISALLVALQSMLIPLTPLMHNPGERNCAVARDAEEHYRRLLFHSRRK